MRSPIAAVALVAALGASSRAAPAAVPDLTPETLAAFTRYVRLTEARIEREVGGAAPFLWMDRQSAAAGPGIAARLRTGEVVVQSLRTRDANRDIEVPGGLIHHWIATVFLPGVTLERTIAFVQDYPRYPQLFQPLIERSTVRSQSGSRFVVSMRTRMQKVITVVLDGDYTIDYRRVSPTRVHTRSVTASFDEVHDAGTAEERREPADRGVGYLWRLNTYCSFDARTDGTYEQCESISLTRGIPFLVRPIVSPFVTGIPRETLAFTLGQVRAGLVR
jgi:hypothetical protein